MQDTLAKSGVGGHPNHAVKVEAGAGVTVRKD